MRRVLHPFGLTNRQWQVMCHLANGKRASEVAEAMNISTRTVEYHKAEVYRVLRVNTTVAALLKLGLIRSAA